MSDRPTASVALLLAAVLGLASGCSGSTVEGEIVGDEGCDSAYDPVARAPSWPALERGMLAYDGGRRPVTAVRVQERGHDLGYGAEDVVRVVDLLDRTGRRVVQVDVWRTPDGGWRAGVWMQCID